MDLIVSVTVIDTVGTLRAGPAPGLVGDFKTYLYVGIFVKCPASFIEALSSKQGLSRSWCCPQIQDFFLPEPCCEGQQYSQWKQISSEGQFSSPSMLFLDKMIYNTDMFFQFKIHHKSEVNGSIPILKIEGSLETPIIGPKPQSLSFRFHFMEFTLWITIKSLFSPKRKA